MTVCFAPPGSGTGGFFGQGACREGESAALLNLLTMKRAALTLFLCLAALPAMAVDPPRDLLGSASWNMIRPSDDIASIETIAAQGLPGGAMTELRVTVKRAVDPFYNIQATADLSATPVIGHRLRFQFWARAEGRNTVRAVVETAGAPYTGVEAQTIDLTPQWKQYTLQETVSQIFDQPLAARLQVGAQAGVMEFAAVKAEDIGVDPAIIAAKREITPSAEAARIRKYRTGPLTIKVVDDKGKPMRDTRVKVEMTRHAFLFGCNFFGLNPKDDSPQQQAYRDRFTTIFNYATLPFYWGAFEPQQGNPDFARVDTMLDWCNAHGITPKAHPLVWHEVYPGWAPKDPDAAIPLMHKRVTDIVTKESGRIPYYDVVNEAANGASTNPPNGESAWLKRDGAPKVVETALGWARSATGGAPGRFTNTPDTFIYNDYETGEPNVALWKAIKKDGKLPDAVGIQSHMHSGPWPMEKVWQICETFAQFDRPIHFTETTVLSGPKRNVDFNGPPATDWNTTVGGEAAQAGYVAQFYTLLFSHPSVHAITWWDFSDRDAWAGAPSGLVRKDMSPKPAYDRLMQLIHHNWWTNASGVTDKAGIFQTRAYYGDYRITLDGPKGHRVIDKVKYPDGSGEMTIVINPKSDVMLYIKPPH